MDAGTVKEYDSPYQLLQQSDSLFRSLCVSSGAYDQLFQIARDAYFQKYPSQQEQ
jgi:hypothetical protein